MTLAERNRLIEEHLPQIRAVTRRAVGADREDEYLGFAVSVFIDRLKSWDPSMGKPMTFTQRAIFGDVRRQRWLDHGPIRVKRQYDRRQADTREKAARAANPIREGMPSPNGVWDEIYPGTIDDHSQAEDREHLDLLASQIPDERLRAVFNLRSHGLTNLAIGQRMGLCESRISQLSTVAIDIARSVLQGDTISVVPRGTIQSRPSPTRQSAGRAV